jgi:hypothetical protein
MNREGCGRNLPQSCLKWHRGIRLEAPKTFTIKLSQNSCMNPGPPRYQSRTLSVPQSRFIETDLSQIPYNPFKIKWALVFQCDLPDMSYSPLLHWAESTGHGSFYGNGDRWMIRRIVAVTRQPTSIVSLISFNKGTSSATSLRFHVAVMSRSMPAAIMSRLCLHHLPHALVRVFTLKIHRHRLMSFLCYSESTASQ